MSLPVLLTALRHSPHNTPLETPRDKERRAEFAPEVESATRQRRLIIEVSSLPRSILKKDSHSEREPNWINFTRGNFDLCPNPKYLSQLKQGKLFTPLKKTSSNTDRLRLFDIRPSLSKHTPVETGSPPASLRGAMVVRRDSDIEGISQCKTS